MRDTASREIAFAIHSFGVRDIVRKCGVTFFALPTRALRRKHKGCIAVNLALYVPYRELHTKYLAQPDMGEPITFIDFREYISEACAGCIYTSGAPEFRTKVLEKWPDARMDDILFLSISAAQSLLRKRAVLSATSGKQGTEELQRRSRANRTGAPRILPVVSPPVPNYDVKGVPIRLIRWGTRTYFSVPWDVEVQPIVLQNGAISKAPPKGVYYIKTLDETFYSLDRLMDSGSLNLTEHSELWSWLESIALMNRKDFQRFRRKNRQLFMAAQDREGKEHLGGIRFTMEEDDVIRDLVRPRMPQESRDILMDVCVGRNWKAILRRARFLCSELIKQGVFDLEKLPHQNYNAGIREEIAAAKKLPVMRTSLS